MMTAHGLRLGFPDQVRGCEVARKGRPSIEGSFARGAGAARRGPRESARFESDGPVPFILPFAHRRRRRRRLLPLRRRGNPWWGRGGPGGGGGACPRVCDLGLGKTRGQVRLLLRPVPTHVFGAHLASLCDPLPHPRPPSAAVSRAVDTGACLRHPFGCATAPLSPCAAVATPAVRLTQPLAHRAP